MMNVHPLKLAETEHASIPVQLKIPAVLWQPALFKIIALAAAALWE